jgi:hypothetical protein
MKYPSKYSNGKTVTAAQFITEIICEKKAKLDKKDLHYRFWLNKEWAGFYRNQIATANKLVKSHNPKAIIKALNSDEAAKIFSLRAPHLKDIIVKYEELLASQSNDISIEIDRGPKQSYRKESVFKKSNIVSKLKELDDDC